MSRTLVLAVVMVALGACKRDPGRFKGPQTLGGKVVAADVLGAGERNYLLYCRACHGDKGDGKGPAALGLRPPPRDFTQGTFKFAAVPGGSLPNDEDLVRIVRSGLHGTAMLAWDGIPEPNMLAIIQYVKTFSPRWKEESPGDPILPTPDPWKGKEVEGAALGKKIYHGLAQCISCHPAYAPKRYIYEASKELTGNPTTDFRDDLYGAQLKESDYGVKLLPPDFTRSNLRSIRPDHELEDLYRVVASGVGGTAMPSWRGALHEDQLWALVHYVDTLVQTKDTSAARETLRDNDAADQGWRPPTLDPQ